MTNPHNPNEPRPGDSPLTQLIVSMSGASGAEHETEPPGVGTESVRAGHEPDKFEVKGILLVPAFVVVTLILAYLLVSGIFFSINESPGAVNDNPQVARQNLDADGNLRPLNERFARISSTDPKNLPDQPGTVVSQPRLEELKITRDKDSNDPPYYRSKLPAAEGNSPELHPEDLRPDRYVSRIGDPVVGRPILAEYGWADQGKRIARMPIDEAIKAVVAQKKLPVRKDPVPIDRTSEDKAKQSSAGRGGPSQPQPTAPTAPAPKKDH
jgi:hypothetical protein